MCWTRWRWSSTPPLPPCGFQLFQGRLIYQFHYRGLLISLTIQMILHVCERWYKWIKDIYTANLRMSAAIDFFGLYLRGNLVWSILLTNFECHEDTGLWVALHWKLYQMQLFSFVEKVAMKNWYWDIVWNFGLSAVRGVSSLSGRLPRRSYVNMQIFPLPFVPPTAQKSYLRGICNHHTIGCGPGRCLAAKGRSINGSLKSSCKPHLPLATFLLKF